MPRRTRSHPPRAKVRYYLAVRPYYGDDGIRFKIVGHDPLGRRVKIATRTRACAERIRAKLIIGVEVESADFEDDTPPAARSYYGG